MTGAVRAAIAAGLMMVSSAASSETSYSILDFKDLDGWAEDNHAAALEVFQNTCNDLKAPDWRSICAAAKDFGDPRQFFELLFRPVLIDDGNPALFTGYFEPELDGARSPTERYKYPLYRMPHEARNQASWMTRRGIETSDALKNRGLEIVWVDDPVELFFLQIQGSGRVKLPDGSYMRVGYGGSNGRPYRSIGVEMVRQGIYKAHQVSAEVIKNWARRNPEAGIELLRHNPSYVFFREVSEVPSHKGPRGAMNRSVTDMRSIAVDPSFTPLGAPVWIEKDGETKMRQLMVAQDTGSAIKGAQRADIFFGTGDAAGKAAGRLRDPGRMVVLLPIQRAYALLPEVIQ